MSPHPDEIFAGPLRDEWFGLDRGPTWLPAGLRAAYERLMPEPPPTLEERAQRCREMGLILCSCTGVETEHGRKLIYDPNCQVHHGERRGVSYR
jgi:hypothetical protein